MNAVVKAEPRKPSLITKMAGMYDMEPAKFASTIKATCIKGKATDEQFAAFLMVADKYDLNPLTKEIYAFPQDGGIVPIVGVDGWSRIINTHPAFDGMEFEDLFDPKGELYAITCVIYRSDRQRPVKVTEYLSECKRNTQPWRQWPARMLRHKAMIQCARMAFGYTGIIEQDEYDRRIEAERAPSPAQTRFASLREEQPRITFDAEIDEVPARDISEELDDEIPLHEAGETQDRETVSGEPVEPETETADDDPSPQTVEAEEAAGASDTPVPVEDDAAASDPAPEESSSADRWYHEALAKMKKAKTAAQAKATLESLQDDLMWYEISDSQCAAIKQAAER